MQFVLMSLCDDIWSTQIHYEIFVLDISLIFNVSRKHSRCVHLGLLTLTFFVTDYHANNDTQFYY